MVALVKDDPVVASARTYLRCARVLAETFDIDVQVRHQQPRATFEATVLACRGIAEGSDGTLTRDDFSFNQVLEVMCETRDAMLIEFRETSRHGEAEVTRREFISSVHDNLIQNYGLQPQRLKEGETGNYAMIDDLMQTFLRRSPSVTSRGAATGRQRLTFSWQR